MSCYEWEEGTIKLPTRDAVRVRDAMKATVAAHSDRLYAEAQRFWKGLPAAYKRDEVKYRRAVAAFVDGNVAHNWNPPGIPDPKLPRWMGFGTDRDGRFGFADDLSWLLSYTALNDYVEVDGRKEWKQGPPRRVQKADIAKLVGKATGARFTIHCGEPTITFAGRSVTWNVPENNHAVDHGRDHPFAQAFFRLLDTVTWTRGSGGVIVGNNEYSRDSRDPGGGANYTTADYGPDRKSSRRVNARSF